MSIRYSQDFKDSLVKLQQEGRSLKSLAEKLGPSKDLCIDDRQLKSPEKLFTCFEVGDVLVLKEDAQTYYHAMRTVKALGQVTKIDNNAYKFEVNWFNRNSWRTKHTNQFQLLPRLLLEQINSDNFFDLLFLNEVLDHIIDQTNFD